MGRVIGFLGLVLAIWLVLQMQVKTFQGAAAAKGAAEQASTAEGPLMGNRSVRERLGDANRLAAERLAKQVD